MMGPDKIVCDRRVSCRPVTFGDGKRYTGRVIYAPQRRAVDHSGV